MLTFFTFSWEFSTWEFFVCSNVHSKSQEIVYYYFVITLWKCEYCLIWVLSKSILFGSNSLKVSLLCDMYSEKGFHYSLTWKELSENVSIVWCLEKCVVLFVSKSMKVSVLFDIKSETCFLLLVVIDWKCEYFFIFWPNVLLLYASGFHAYILWPLGWLWLKNHLIYIWFFEVFPCNSFLPDFRLKKDGQLNSWVTVVHLDWYH